MTPRCRLVAVAGACLAAFLVDQTTKWIMIEVVMRPPRIIPVGPFLNLTLGFNPGISFGLFGDAIGTAPVVASAVKFAIAAGLVIWALRTSVAFEAFGLALVAGGGAGNAIDRARQGAVADFLDVHWGDWHFPAFNFADVAITLGVILMLVGAMRGWTAAPVDKTPAGAPQPKEHNLPAPEASRRLASERRPRCT